MVIGQGNDGESCPTGLPSAAPPSVASNEAAWHPYSITVIDASSGGDALSFDQEIPDCQNHPRPPEFGSRRKWCRCPGG